MRGMGKEKRESGVVVAGTVVAQYHHS